MCAEALERAGLAQIIGLGMQLLLGLREQLIELEPLRQQPEQAQHPDHVVDIAVDALAHLGVLNLDRQIPPVGAQGPVHLADGGRCQGLEGEALEPLFPAGTPGRRERRRRC